MTTSRYKVVFDGRIAEGCEVGRVKEKLASLYGIDSQKIERIFEKSPVVIRKDLDRQSAERFRRAFEKTGALCRIAPIDGLGLKPHVIAESKEEARQPLRHNGIECPNCGYEQMDSPECQRCGIIFSRFRERLHCPPMVSIPSRELPLGLRSPARRLSRRSTVLLFVVFSLMLFGAYRWRRNQPVHHGPGMVAPSVPRQEMMKDGAPFFHKDYQVTPLASFWIEARVLSTKRYRSGRESDLSPVDLALGWGPMSDEVVLKYIEVGQSSRFYYWRARNLPIPPELIEVSSANVHLIPASKDIARRVGRARRGNVVIIKGYLVQVDGNDGWRWRSSLTRTDTGAGACEIIWVEDFEIL